MLDERLEPPHRADERSTLNAFLDYQRQTVVGKVEGLDREQLTRRLVPSKTTALGIVKHLTDVERWWFQVVFAGAPDEPYYWERDGVFDSEFDIDDGDDPHVIVAKYRAECDRSRLVVGGAASLDDVSRRADRLRSLRWILVHLVEETARHAGHLDLIRELIDGEVGE